MPAALAIALVVLLIAVAIAIPVLALRPGKLGDGLLVAFPLGVVALLSWQFGYFGGQSTPQVSMASIEMEDPAEAACARIREELTKAGLVIDDSQPGRLVLNGALWRQVPPQLRDDIARCFAPGEGEAEIEVVEAPSVAN